MASPTGTPVLASLCSAPIAQLPAAIETANVANPGNSYGTSI